MKNHAKTKGLALLLSLLSCGLLPAGDNAPTGGKPASPPSAPSGLTTGNGASQTAVTQPFVFGRPDGRILAAGDRRILILDPSGSVVWEYPTKLTHDAWMLSSGNILFADGESVTEVTSDKQVVFQYRSKEQKGGATYACQRLADGRTLIGENSTGRVLEVDASGAVVFSLQTTPVETGNHHNMRMARKLDNGNYLVCQSGAGLVKEYTPKGEVAWQVKVAGPIAFAALRTGKGTTLVSSLDQITEYDTSGKIIWECKRQDVAGTSIQNMTGMHLLPNGNVIIGCYQAYGKGGDSGLLEISRDKTLLWRYTNPKADTTMMAVELLPRDGTPPLGMVRR